MPIFDIFSGTVDNGAIWQCSVEGFAEAVFIMKKLAAAKPGAYFVYDTEAARVLAEITGPVPQPQNRTQYHAA